MTSNPLAKGSEIERCARQERPPRERKLTRTEVVQAALVLAAEVGADRLTMRGLAEKLNVSPMATYNHVKSKKELMILLVDAVLGRVELPTTDELPWYERLRRIQMSVRDEIMHYPGLSVVLLDLRETAAGRRVTVEMLAILQEAGFDAQQSDLVLGVIHTYLVGVIAMDASFAHTLRRKGGSQSRHPLERVHESAGQFDLNSYLNFGLDAIIDAVRLRAPEEGCLPDSRIPSSMREPVDSDAEARVTPGRSRPRRRV